VYTEFWWENLREIDKFEGPDIDGRIILKWIFRKWDVGAWNASIWFRIRSGECSNEHSGSTKWGEILD